MLCNLTYFLCPCAFLLTFTLKLVHLDSILFSIIWQLMCFGCFGHTHFPLEFIHTYIVHAFVVCKSHIRFNESCIFTLNKFYTASVRCGSDVYIFVVECEMLYLLFSSRDNDIIHETNAVDSRRHTDYTLKMCWCSTVFAVVIGI